MPTVDELQSHDTGPGGAAPTTAAGWRSLAAGIGVDPRARLGSGRVEGRGAAFTSADPATGAVVAAWTGSEQALVDRAVAEARAAAPAWRCRGAAERAALLARLAGLVRRDAHRLALADTLEMGMPVAQALADIDWVAANLELIGALAAEVERPDVVTDGARRVEQQRRPHGVVAAITPWNFPLYTAVAKIAPALAAGNCVILKPSEVASLSAHLLADLAAEACLPLGVLAVLPGLGHETGAALARHRDIDCLSFTGSTATGAAIMQEAGAAGALKPLLLECGGKSPQILCPDLALDMALADAVAAAVFWNAGQLCVAGSRLLVPRDRLAEAAAVMGSAAQAWRPGDPMDPATRLGPLASFPQRARVDALVQRGLAAGARLVCGGAVPPGEGAFYPPTVVVADDPANVLAREEVFGPVLAIIPYDDADDAVARANAVAYGLTATVLTRDGPLGLGIASRLEAGGVTISASGAPAALHVERFGMEPVKASGFGAEGGIPGLLAMTRARLLSVDPV